MLIKLTTGKPELAGLIMRQSPYGKGRWGNNQFIVKQDVEYCDWWFVCHSSSLVRPEVTRCDPEHIVYISMEPTEQWVPSGFHAQFSKLILCDRKVQHRNIQYTNGLTWWCGINVRHENGHHFSPDYSLNYDILKTMMPVAKQKIMSVICSKNRSLPGHTKRLEFLERLKNHAISKHIDFFGGGHNPILDKWHAIAPYKYHIVLENSVVPDYWSEKLADAYLGFSLPIYYGCPNISNYFSSNSFCSIDIDDFESSVSILNDLIQRDPYNGYVHAIIEARKLVLDQYNIFQLMSEICKEPAKQQVLCKLKPVSHIVRSWPRRIVRKAIYSIRGIK
ncbi:MAG: glycosyltransferase family 10 [Legionellaceae bacterium]|nr:glycosyltransferase family 10 [Legionellaceae bacterium]